MTRCKISTAAIHYPWFNSQPVAAMNVDGSEEANPQITEDFATTNAGDNRWSEMARDPYYVDVS